MEPTSPPRFVVDRTGSFFAANDFCPSDFSIIGRPSALDNLGLDVLSWSCNGWLPHRTFLAHYRSALGEFRARIGILVNRRLDLVFFELRLNHSMTMDSYQLWNGARIPIIKCAFKRLSFGKIVFSVCVRSRYRLAKVSTSFLKASAVSLVILVVVAVKN